MFISGGNNLFNHYPEIDTLNVFPVPDGDTGTNMNLTITSGSKEIVNIHNVGVDVVSKTFSRGLLMGARGNSGVILSQIFRGFTQAVTGKESLTIQEFADAWSKGCEVAYKAVVKPVEGTILTVIREASEALAKAVDEKTTAGMAMETLLTAAQTSLLHTPELLPVLKEVGVVDSGGAGLVRILEGMESGLKGILIERKAISINHGVEEEKQEETEKQFKYHIELGEEIVSAVGKRKFNPDVFTKVLEGLGKNVVLLSKDNKIWVELDCDKPGMVLNQCQNYGEITNLTFKSLSDKEQITKEFFNKEEPRKPIAIISTSVGPGLEELFKGLEVSYIVSGGQTMNPSTEDFVNAIAKVHAEKVIILPNNKNILMAAQQACDNTEECVCKVVPSTTILQGIVACMMFSPEGDFESNLKDMNEGIKNIKSGQVTFSIKDTCIDDVEIKKDYFMGINDGKIACCLENKHDAAKELLSKMIDDMSSIVTIIYGEDVKEEEANELAKYIEETYSIEVEVHYGGQPVYSYYLGVE